MDHNLKIMVIDDEEIVCNRLKSSLRKSGYLVETFTESTKAMDELVKNRYDIVVSDLKMPKIDGMEIFHSVQNRYPDTKIIIISGFATLEKAKEVKKEGVYDFIVKPFRISYLKEVIEKAASELQ